MSQTNPAAPTRDGGGRFARDAATALRDADAVQLRLQGLSYRQIADRLGVDVSTAHAAVQRALDATLSEPTEQLRQLELERLDNLYVAALEVLEREHVHVSNGHVVRGSDGRPVRDDGPRIAAIGVAVRVSEARRKLLGLDAPVKQQISGSVTYEVVGIDPADLT